MIKLITPVGRLVALLAIYATYAVWVAYTDEWLLYGLFGLLCWAACVRTALLRRRSQYLVYVLTALFVVGWFYTDHAGASIGYFRFFFESPTAAAKSLAPGVAVVVLSCIASRLTYSHFRAARKSARA
jgi:hypothetical protein